MIIKFFALFSALFLNLPNGEEDPEDKEQGHVDVESGSEFNEFSTLAHHSSLWRPASKDVAPSTSEHIGANTRGRKQNDPFSEFPGKNTADDHDDNGESPVESGGVPSGGSNDETVNESREEEATEDSKETNF